MTSTSTPMPDAGPATMATACRLFAELRRYALTHREQAIAEVILKFSVMYGRGSVRIPKLETFHDLTGITRGNVHETLRRLHEMRVVSISVCDGMPAYRINPDVSTWACRTRISRDSILRAYGVIKEANEKGGGGSGREQDVASTDVDTAIAISEFADIPD